MMPSLPAGSLPSLAPLHLSIGWIELLGSCLSNIGDK